MDDNLSDQLQRISNRVFEAYRSLGWQSMPEGTDRRNIDYARQQLDSAREILDRIIADDKESGAAHKRWLLRGRIRRMVEKICREEKKKEWEIHRQWLELGGSPQDAMSVYELQRKVDWLYASWPTLFKRDTRDWQPPAELSGMEPSLVKRSSPDDIE